MRQFERSVVAANKYCTNRAQLLKQKKNKNEQKKQNKTTCLLQPGSLLQRFPHDVWLHTDVPRGKSGCAVGFSLQKYIITTAKTSVDTGLCKNDSIFPVDQAL